MSAQHWVLYADVPIRRLVVTMAEKILLADGETVLLDTLADTLTSEGYETFRANDGFEAMRVTVESTSDLIITGVQILVLVGCLSTRYVRRASDISVVMMTEGSLEADAHLSLSIEETLKNDRLETFSQMAVRKIDGVTPIPSRGLSFKVNSRIIKLDNRSRGPDRNRPGSVTSPSVAIVTA